MNSCLHLMYSKYDTGNNRNSLLTKVDLAITQSYIPISNRDRILVQGSIWGILTGSINYYSQLLRIPFYYILKNM